ncbi:MAG: DUF302 domain-containing protein [Spirochaetia bacterium]|nr:DUF302 domain-containing protein [Spirochaetia bacterium]
MSYSFSKIVSGNFDQAIENVTEELKKEGFGVLTEIDVKATMKKKIDKDMKPYKILGACNPGYAFKAIESENMIGLMLPCNVLVRETNEGKIEVSAIDPVKSMMAVENKDLHGIATEVRAKLSKVIESLN